jgi:nicotinate phosphoribosyltransferase
MPSALSTDLYQLTMMAAYTATGQTSPSTFGLFVRELPESRNYLVAAGLEQALDYLEHLAFGADEIAWLRTVPALASAPAAFFDEVLPTFRFSGDVWAMREGEVAFPYEPLLRVTAPAPEAQLVETAVLAIVGFQTSVASKAARIVDAAAGRPVVEFGTRRAHGLEAGALAARAACLAGFDGTSNVDAGRRFGLTLSGTMAHSWVMTFEDEIEAFARFLDLFGPKATLLIDTYDSVVAAHRIVQARLRPAAVRLDSGDLASLSRAVRAIFDAGGLAETRILASGDLDEYRIAALIADGAPIDAFGVGTAVSAVRDAPALGAVYKLVDTMRGGEHVPKVKLSAGKRTIPGLQQVWRSTASGVAHADVIGLADERGRDGRPLLRCVMKAGRRIDPPRPATELASHARASRGELPASVRALHTPAPFKVEISPELDALTRLAAHRHAM